MNKKDRSPGDLPENQTESPADVGTSISQSVHQVLRTPASDAVPSLSTHLPYLPPEQFELILSQRNRALAQVNINGNPYALPVGGRQLNNLLRAHARASGVNLRKWELEAINEQVSAAAELSGKVTEVWYRVAPRPCGGVEIDLGDATHTRVRVTAGQVEVIRSSSDAVFCVTPPMLPLPTPSDQGNLDLLYHKVNLDRPSYWLLIGWLAYTLARPKAAASRYVILVLQGDQGSGKSFLCVRIILGLLDPNQLGAQVFPYNAKDLAIMAEHAHVLVFDNMRNFRAAMSDLLCMTSTGGTLSNRALYSNADLYTHHVHVAVVLAGIHHLITQPDLAERCLTLHTGVLKETERKSEADLIRELERDMPEIFRGLLDLTASILAELPQAEVKYPQRMIDFVHWLAAMERALGFDAPVLQAQYADTLHETQRDALLDTLLGSAVVEFSAHINGQWTGTPTQLLGELNNAQGFGSASSKEWPSNPIALSKRLNALKASLRTQGILVEIRRGKERVICIRKEGADHE